MSLNFQAVHVFWVADEVRRHGFDDELDDDHVSRAAPPRPPNARSPLDLRAALA
jgi:hypothetical protein